MSDSSTPRARARRNTVLRLLRRTHMYLGLALVPWVLLYGATALLFNHGTWLNDATRLELSADDVAGPWLEAMPSPAAVAGQAVDRLADLGGDDLRLLDDSALWVGRVELRGRAGEHAVRVAIDPYGGGGYVRRYPDREEDRLPDWADERALGDWRPLPDATRAAFAEAPPGVDGMPISDAGSLRLRRWPEVRFRMTDGERIYNCDLAMNGEIEVRSLEQFATTRDKLLRLHKQHVDPGYAGARQTWTWLVDIMGWSMVLWGLTGVVMWWGIKSTRKAGLVAMLSGVVAIAVMASTLWKALGVG